MRDLPSAAATILARENPPPRLMAHLRLVHDVAYQLTDRLAGRLVFDREAVLFGAATHDIGKIVHRGELTGPGHAHEPTGRALLLDRGVPDRLARFAGTHGSWTAPDATVEDLLVSLSDNAWKAKRVPDLEALVIDRLGTAAGVEPWQAFMDLDDVLTALAADADERLAYQARHPV